MQDCKIVAHKHYFEVFIDGEFYCSADSISEAEREIEIYQMKGVAHNESVNQNY